MSGCIVDGHTWMTCDKPGYRKCVTCGSYQSSDPVGVDFYRDNYWSNEKGRSTIAEQVYNVDVLEINGKTKNQFVLDYIPESNGGLALEIACAPGVLLDRITSKGYRDVEGIEVDERYVPDIAKHCGGAKITIGEFPNITRNNKNSQLDLIVGLDIFEHIEDGAAFLVECIRLLKHRGHLVMMLPLASDDLPERFFDPKEHAWIYSHSFVKQMMLRWGFGMISFHRWTPGHDLVEAVALL